MLFVQPPVGGHLGVRFFPPGCFDPPVLPGYLGAGRRVILTSHTQAMLNFPGPLLTFTCLSLARLSFPAGMSFTGEIGHGQEKGAICECGQLPSGAMDTLGDLESH